MSSRTRNRFRRRNFSHRRFGIPPLGEIGKLPPGAQRVQYTITEEPLPDPVMDALSPEMRERLINAGQRLFDGETVDVQEFEALVQELPDCPPACNFLCCVYQRTGQVEKVGQLIEETHRRFPKYLIGMCNYARWLMSRGRLGEVEALLQNRFGIHLWITDRRVYHITEFVIFNGLMVQFFLTKGKPERALAYMDLLRSVAPQHQQTRQIEELFDLAMNQMLAGMAKRVKREALRARLHAADPSPHASDIIRL